MLTQTMTVQKVTAFIPEDIRTIYHETGWMIADLDDETAEAFKEWRQECRDVARDSKSGLNVNWSSVRESLNEACDDGGYPRLF